MDENSLKKFFIFFMILMDEDKKKKEKKRTTWVRDTFKERIEKGTYNNLIQEM